jgi:DNA-binding response OmpR family regulator
MLPSMTDTHTMPYLVSADISSHSSSGEWGRSLASTRPTRVLIITNDDSVQQQIASYLESHAMWVCMSAPCWNMITRLLATAAPDVIVIEGALYGADWIDLLQRSRPYPSSPATIVIGHGHSETERVSALELGADAYLSERYGLRELVARIRAIVRRKYMGRNAALREMHYGRCRFGGWELDRQTCCLTANDGAYSKLTKGDYALLLAFLDAPECPLTREHLLHAIRVHEDVFDRSIDARVLRLRRKLATGSDMPQIIQTVRGVGYLLAVAVEWCTAPISTHPCPTI